MGRGDPVRPAAGRLRGRDRDRRPRLAGRAAERAPRQGRQGRLTAGRTAADGQCRRRGDRDAKRASRPLVRGHVGVCGRGARDWTGRADDRGRRGRRDRHRRLGVGALRCRDRRLRGDGRDVSERYLATFRRPPRRFRDGRRRRRARARGRRTRPTPAGRSRSANCSGTRRRPTRTTSRLPSHRGATPLGRSSWRSKMRRSIPARSTTSTRTAPRPRSTIAPRPRR